MKNLGTKITVASLASLMSMAMVGGIAGTVAWYQFNTRVTATVIGTNVSNTGVLQISKDGAEWTRDLITEDLIGARDNALITPVTFGQLNADGSLPAQAYKAPDASENAYVANVDDLGSYAKVYQQADKDLDYIQYDVFLRTMAATDGGLEQVSLPVFLSDILLEDIGGEITKGLRVHLAVDEDNDDSADKFVFLSKDGVEHLALSGLLDLDADGKADVKGGYEGNANRDKVVVYGNDGEYQKAQSIADVKASRDANGDIDPWALGNIDKIICHTQVANPVKVTVTIWFEGWDDVVDNMEIDSDEIIFRKAEYVYADSVEGLFVEDAGEYVAAHGKAVEGTDYFELFYKPLELEEFDVVPAHSYTEAAGVYSETADVVAQPGETYYSRIVKAADVHYAESVTGKYIYNLLTEEYEEIVGDVKAVDGADYFEKVTHDEAYAVVPFEDAHGDPLPADTRSVEGLYTLDAGVYHKAHGMNALGVTYYKLTTGGKATVPTWNGEDTDNAGFRFGLTFDVGKNAFKA